ncbi:hypothetical protein LJR231_001532 [Phyllobacterium sp. LjRoot231]|uniref:hypothetical protein n=1 Tax=Phyllobacterium sp. LjRoot231 TaxID=3342289 RepID=UPI003ECFDB6C
MTNPFLWYWAHGAEPESYSVVDVSTREAAIAAARADDAHVHGFTIIEANKKVPTTNIFDADNVLEQYEEHNEESWGEDGSMIHAESAQKAELEKMLADALWVWMGKHGLHGHNYCFGETRNEEYFPAERTVQ